MFTMAADRFVIGQVTIDNLPDDVLLRNIQLLSG